MAEDTGGREFDVAKLIQALDADTNSPDKRAARIFATLPQSVTDYDVLCFAIEFIAGKSQQMPWLEAPAKELVRKLYIMHGIKHKDLEWLDSVSTRTGQTPE